MIQITVHSTGTGSCSLTGKEGDGLTVTFEDGTATETFLSFGAFKQLLKMKVGAGKQRMPLAEVIGNDQ